MWAVSDLLITLAYYCALFFIPFIGYILFFEENKNKGVRYKIPDWYYLFKRYLGIPTIKKLKTKCRNAQEALDLETQEQPKKLSNSKQTDTQVIHGLDRDGNWIFLKIILRQHRIAEVVLQVKLSTGKAYKLPNEPQVLLCSIPSRQWRAEGLNLTVLEPFRRLRITYNGLLRGCDKDGTIEHVKFNFIWNTSDRPLHYPQDASTSLLADALAMEPWRDGDWIDLIGNQRGYEQYGALQGFISGTSFPDDHTLYFPCFRKRYWGTAENFGLHREFSAFVVAEDGTLINVGSKSLKKGCAQVRYGTMITNTGFIRPIDSHDIHIECVGEDSIPEALTIHLEAKRKTFKCILHLDVKSSTITYSDAFKGWVLRMVPAQCILNGQPAQAVTSFWYPRHGLGVGLPNPLLTEQKLDVKVTSFVVAFTSRESQVTVLAGGKGSSLGLLSSLKSKNFEVPPGFVVLSTAFDFNLKENTELMEGVLELEAISRGTISKDLAQACQAVTELFASSTIHPNVAQAILEELKLVRGGGTAWKWAVRSSGLSEDSEELSAAGQNATFLGCASDEEVLKAVAACWGSLFAFQSVQYRRQHGLDINCSMGVVIQRMVPSETAGVLFTCHPTTGNPGQLVITSNYGLGESVVSGHAEPDTVVLARTHKNELSVESKTIGSKKISIKVSENGGTIEEARDDVSQSLSLTEEQALKLGAAGVELEKAYGTPRDIEWAFSEGRLYLLQARPITTLANWTDFELLHEFDTPVLTEQELHTIANIGEVMPGASTPLSQSFVLYDLNKVIFKYAMSERGKPFTLKMLGTTHHHCVINVTNGFFNRCNDKITVVERVLDMSIFGHPVTNEKLHAVGKARYGVLTGSKRLYLMLEGIWNAFNADKVVRKAVEVGYRFKLKMKEHKTAADMFTCIENAFKASSSIYEYHILATNGSVFFQIVTMNILAANASDITNDHYCDIALLLSSCTNVVSAEIPKALERISNIIRESGVAEKFVKIKPEDGANWLRISCPKAGEELDAFMQKHGHRSLREFELQAPSWSMEPSIVIGMLQVNCKGQGSAKGLEVLDADSTVKKLITPKSDRVRSILKFLVKRCRKAVAQREATKSELVRVISACKEAFKETGKQMVLEGTIPHESLIYFFSIYELKQILKTKDPGLVQKALRRERLYPQWDKIRIPELLFGVPKIEEDDSAIRKLLESNEGKIRINGTPVCPGDLVARACVINSLDEIDQLRAGDILITFSTDIGWSPYFPILAAVVTELGGLISHGAVVAREYGLPCIVGAQNATKVFKTGDRVLLSGKNGIIELVESATQ